MKTITLIVNGSVSAAKAETLYNLLIEQYTVNLLITHWGRKFVSEDFYKKSINYLNIEKEKYDRNDISYHVKLGKESDLIVIYPASHNFIAKVANGISDEVCSLLISAYKKIVISFESMNENMLLNKAYIRNKKFLINEMNFVFKDAKYGELANKDMGLGRLWEPEEAKAEIDSYFNINKKLINKKILFNMGRTRSYIDSVRFITNKSSGKLGISILNKVRTLTNNYKCYFGDNDVNISKNSHQIECKTNQGMLDAILEDFDDCDVFIASAALTDFKSSNYKDSKISKDDKSSVSLDFEKDIDVLSYLGKIKKNQILVGFSLKDEIDIEVGYAKLNKKNCDLLVVNNKDTMNSENINGYIINRFNKDKIKLSNISKAQFCDILFENIGNIIEKQHFINQ